MKKIIFLLALGLSVIFTSAAYADDPADVNKLIKTSMDDVMGIAKRSDINNEQKQKELWQVVLRTFDFDKVTEFTLGKFSYDSKVNLGEYSDRRFTKEQQADFREVFTKHLSNTYLDSMDLDKIDLRMDLKPAEILETKKGVKRAQVKTIVNKKTPIDYIFLNDGKGWKVYDVKVEGRSLVQAFRAEYNNILIKEKPNVLIKMLKDKVAEHDKAKKHV